MKIPVTGYRPRTTLEVGVRRFVEWYLQHYQAQAAAG